MIKSDQMVILRIKEIRRMGSEELNEKLQELHTELATEKGAIASGTRAENPGRIKELRRTIARILTVLHERKTEKTGIINHEKREVL